MRVIIDRTEDIDPKPCELKLAEAGFTVEYLTVDSAGIAGQLGTADYLVSGYTQLTRERLAAAQKLRAIATFSAGTDQIDLAAANELGIPVLNIPDAAVEEVAVHALTMILSGERHIPYLVHEQRAGQWRALEYPVPRRLSELTLGVVGYGKIGRRLAQLASPLFDKIVYFDPFVQVGAEDPGQSVSLTDLYARADVISMHMPATPETIKMFNAEAFTQMKDRVGLVNVARGNIVDSGDLIDAVSAGKVSYAMLDVTDPEPLPAEHALWNVPGVFISPHIGFLSEGSQLAYELQPAENILAWHESGTSPNLMNNPQTRAV